MMKKILTLMFAAILSIAATSVSSADTIVLNEDFTYADGALVPNGSWVNHSGTAGTLGVAAGAASVTQDSGSEDAHAVFAPVSTGVLTAMFDISVTADAAMSGTDFEYFAHFMTDSSTNFGARIDVQTPNGTGDYTLGIGAGSSSDDTLSTDFNFGDTVSVLLAYDFDTLIATVTAGGSTATAGVDTDISFDSFALRQSNSSSDETITVDNLVITSVPEPSSIALLGLVGLAGVVRRRK